MTQDPADLHDHWPAPAASLRVAPDARFAEHRVFRLVNGKIGDR